MGYRGNSADLNVFEADVTKNLCYGILALVACSVLSVFFRVLIVDWDIHHGQGVQYCYEDDPRWVLPKTFCCAFDVCVCVSTSVVWSFRFPAYSTFLGIVMSIRGSGLSLENRTLTVLAKTKGLDSTSMYPGTRSESHVIYKWFQPCEAL